MPNNHSYNPNAMLEGIAESIAAQLRAAYPEKDGWAWAVAVNLNESPPVILAALTAGPAAPFGFRTLEAIAKAQDILNGHGGEGDAWEGRVVDRRPNAITLGETTPTRPANFCANPSSPEAMENWAENALYEYWLRRASPEHAKVGEPLLKKWGELGNDKMLWLPQDAADMLLSLQGFLDDCPACAADVAELVDRAVAKAERRHPGVTKRSITSL